MRFITTAMLVVQLTLANPVFTADFTQFQKIPEYIASINKPNLGKRGYVFFWSKRLG